MTSNYRECLQNFIYYFEESLILKQVHLIVKKAEIQHLYYCSINETGEVFNTEKIYHIPASTE